MAGKNDITRKSSTLKQTTTSSASDWYSICLYVYKVYAYTPIRSMYVIGAILCGGLLLGAALLLSGLQVVDVVLPEPLRAVRVGLLAARAGTSRAAEADLRGVVQLLRLHLQLLVLIARMPFRLVRVDTTRSFRRL